MISEVYISYDDKGRYYLGASKFSNEEYLGSYTDKNFSPTGKMILSKHKSWLICQLVEAGLQKAWQVTDKLNKRFINQSVFPVVVDNPREFTSDLVLDDEFNSFYLGKSCVLPPVKTRIKSKYKRKTFLTKELLETRNRLKNDNPMFNRDIREKHLQKVQSPEHRKKISLFTQGGRNPRAIEVTTPVGTFPCKKDACEALSISFYLLNKFIKDENKPDYYLNDYPEREYKSSDLET